MDQGRIASLDWRAMESDLDMSNKSVTDVNLDDVGPQWVRQSLDGSVCVGSIILPELDFDGGKAVVLGVHGEIARGRC